MATVSTTPVQVALGWVQFGNQQNPFYIQVGSSLYQVLFSGQGTSPANAIGIFKRSAASVGGAWMQQDATHSPDQGLQSGYGVVSVNGTVISIAYLQTTQFALKIVTYDTAADLWGTPGPAFNLVSPLTRFAFVQRSDNTYVVVAATPFRIYYLTYAASTWSASTDILLTGGMVLGGVIDSSDRIHFLKVDPSSPIADYMQLSASFVLGSVLYSIGALSMTEGQFASIALWGSDTVVIGYRPITGSGAFTVRVAFATPLSAPVITDTQVYAQNPSAGFSEKTSSVQTAVALDATLSVFFTDTNFSLPVNQIMQGVWNGSAWSTSIFYDAVANRPTNGLPGSTSAQLVQTIQGVQLSGGWTVATAMVVNDIANPPRTLNTAEFLEAASSPPIPPTPPPPSGPGVITCQINISPAGAAKTLRYEIPQRRWFPHTYND